jgi:hypothetical protein
LVDESKKRAEQEELLDARSEFEISLKLALRTGVSGVRFVLLRFHRFK